MSGMYDIISVVMKFYNLPEYIVCYLQAIMVNLLTIKKSELQEVVKILTAIRLTRFEPRSHLEQ